MIEFPRFVFRGKAEMKLVEDAESLDSALSDGWYADRLTAINPPKVEEQKHEEQKEPVNVPPVIPDEDQKQEDNAPPTREEMEVQAKALNLKFDGRTSDKKLMALIAEALEA